MRWWSTCRSVGSESPRGFLSHEGARKVANDTGNEAAEVQRPVVLVSLSRGGDRRRDCCEVAAGRNSARPDGHEQIIKPYDAFEERWVDEVRWNDWERLIDRKSVV